MASPKLPIMLGVSHTTLGCVAMLNKLSLFPGVQIIAKQSNMFSSFMHPTLEMSWEKATMTGNFLFMVTEV